MIYCHSPKSIVIAGPPAAGKSTAARQLRDTLGYSLLSLDEINSAISANLNIEISQLRQPHPAISKEFTENFLSRIRNLRYTNIVVEGCRISHPHVFGAFKSALANAYGEYVIVKPFYLNPDRDVREKQYLLRQAVLAKNAAKYGDTDALYKLKHEYSKGFCDYLEPILNEFEEVKSASQIIDYALASKDARHKNLPLQHQNLIKQIAESGTFNPFYQRVEVGNEIVIRGFTDSVKSWENILNFHVQFEGKKVCDIGCMHGYYSFKAEELGATVTGFDIDHGAITAAKHIAQSRNSSCAFDVFNVENPFAVQFDIIFALNVLHRVKKFELVCRNIFHSANEFILEIGEIQLQQLLSLAKEFGLRMKKVIKSHRCSDVVGQRVLLHIC